VIAAVSKESLMASHAPVSKAEMIQNPHVTAKTVATSVENGPQPLRIENPHFARR
jgi:hypothetical protein